MSVTYPTDIVTDDGDERIHVGHSLDRSALLADYEYHCGPAPDGFATVVREVWLTYTPRIKWCERIDGWGCGSNGEWHGHWFEVKPSPGAQFTLVGWRRVAAEQAAS